ncbi:MAG: hypothetical protein L3J28_04735 [Candidatus Polarisedimenticolaceae bacterium]|nr:hypothetical protein [Candidatus Polarisedimenticolaceae bacterium]
MFSPLRIDPTERQIRWVAALLSILFSVLVIALDQVVNNDGALYLIVSDLITQGEWQAALARYPWPFLPILISYTSQLTGLIPEYSAYLLSTLFFVLLVLCFIDFVRQLGGDRRTQLLAALLILTLPYLNESRAEILRDHGYWLFYLLGLRFLFKHYKSPSLMSGLAWNGAILISCLFRMEGFVMMALLPFILLLKRESPLKQRFSNFVQANWISLALLVVGLILLPFAGDNLGRLAEFPARMAQFWNALTVGLVLKAEVIRSGVLPVLSAKFAMQSVVSILALIIVVKTLTVMTSLYAVVLFLPRLYAEVVLPKGFRPFVGWVVLINLLMLIIFLLPTFFLQARFTMPLVLTVLLLLPFLLNRAWSLWQEKSDSWFYSRLFPVVIVITLLMGADGLISIGGYSKAYLRDAAEWIEQNSETGSKIVTSESDRFCYYIGRNSAFEQRLLCRYVVEPRANMAFDYLVLYQKKGMMPDGWKAYLGEADLHEVAKFENSRHDGMTIYQRKK